MEIVGINQISPDQVIIWSWGFITLNVTILYTWLVMGILDIYFLAGHAQSFLGNECFQMAAFSGSRYIRLSAVKYPR